MRLPVSIRPALRLLAGAALCALGLALAFVLAESGRAVNPKLTGTVGPGATITLEDGGGNGVTNLAPGTYDIEVHDNAGTHNFHLKGPGVDKMTTVAESGTVTTWTVSVGNGTYTYKCDAHPTTMKGSFTVGSGGTTTGATTGTTTGATATGTTDTTTTATTGTTTAVTTGTTPQVTSTTGTTTGSTEGTSTQPPSQTQTILSSPRTESLVVAALRVKANRGTIEVRLRVNHAARARLSVRRGRISRSASFRLRRGANVLRLRLGSKRRPGLYRLRLAISDTAGNARLVTRIIRVR